MGAGRGRRADRAASLAPGRSRQVSEARVVLFDIDGTLINTGGAGGRAWAAAFQKLFGVPADITRFSEVGMTDPNVARQTFEGSLGREPAEDELARLIMGYVMELPD